MRSGFSEAFYPEESENEEQNNNPFRDRPRGSSQKQEGQAALQHSLQVRQQMFLVEKAAKAWRLCRHHYYLEAVSLLTRYVPGGILLFKRSYLVRLKAKWIGAEQKWNLPVRLATGADIGRLAMLVDRERGHWEALRQGRAFCVIAESDGNIIGYEFCHMGGSHYEQTLDYRFDVGPRGAWCYDAYVHPSYRQRGVWRAIQTRITEYLGNSYEFYALVDFANHVSLRAHLTYGFRIARRFTEIDLWGFRFIFNKPFPQSMLPRVARRLRITEVAGGANILPAAADRT